MKALLYDWIRDCVKNHKIRLCFGLFVLVAELWLYFASGVMLEEVTHYHTGEGSWEMEQGGDANSFCQEFVPEHPHLTMISFLMSKRGITADDGYVKVLISDAEDRILFEKNLSFSEVADEYFTDVETDIQVSPRKKHYLTLVSFPSSNGEYPAVCVCDKSIKLPENRALVYGDELPDTQLVGRYGYRDVMLPSKARNILVISLLTAFGILFGLPEDVRIRRIAGVVLLAAVPCILGSRLEMLTHNGQMYLPFALKWNVGIMYALELVVLLFTHSARVSVILTNVSLTLLYSANYFMVMYRKTYLRLNDFTAIGTVKEVMPNYSFVPNSHLAFAWGICLLAVVYALFTGKPRGTKKTYDSREEARKHLLRKGISYVVTIMAALLFLRCAAYQLLRTDLLVNAGFQDEDFRGFCYDQMYMVNGYLVASIIEYKDGRIEKPEGYSIRRVEEILSEHGGRPDSDAETGLSQDGGSDLPHVILIMNESFSDLRLLGELELNRDNLRFWDSLRENTVRGYVNASVIGGGTANSEFEVFTGCDMALLPINYYPYQQGIRKPVNSLVSQMKKNGYTTYSMHPEVARNWNRVNIYRYYGFDHSLWKQDFKGDEVIHSGVSDAATYDKVIELYEAREPGEKMFLFDLTIQNHGGYPAKEKEYAIHSANLQNPAIDEYLTLVDISDKAFEGLIRYFERQDEKVIVCMYGDHQPSLSDAVLDYYHISADSDPLRMMDKYKVPFVIWANYDIEEADGYDISMNYLGGLLQETAGIERTPYFQFLESLREDYPIITVNGLVDAEGVYHNYTSDDEALADYRILQYNYLFDENQVKWGY